jgi:hypothetical protein
MCPRVSASNKCYLRQVLFQSQVATASLTSSSWQIHQYLSAVFKRLTLAPTTIDLTSKHVLIWKSWSVLSGYGKFNYLLLLAILPASLASIFSSSAMSYVLPSAECDLKLTMFDKGLLNSMTFVGGIPILINRLHNDTVLQVREGTRWEP